MSQTNTDTNTKLQLSPIENSPYYGKWLKTDAERDIAKTFVEKKLGHYTAEDITEIVKLLKKWKEYIGITGMQNVKELVNNIEVEFITLIQFLYDNFKHITYTDLKLARDWAVMGVTDLSKVSKKTLSAEYVSRSIMLYEERKRDIVAEIIRNKTTYDRMLESSGIKKQQTPAEKADTFKSIIMGHYDSYKKNVLFVDFGDYVYNWIKANHLLPVTPELKAEADKYASTRYANEKSEINVTRALAGEPLIKETEDSEEAKKNKYRKHYAITTFFDIFDITDIVKMITPQQFIQHGTKAGI